MKKVYRVQRLAKKEEGAVIARIFWLSILSLVLIAVLFTVGLKFLGGFADFLSNVFKQDSTEEVSSNEVPAPPIVDSLPKATNTETITISGFSGSASKVEIYLDSSKAGEIDTQNGRFEFKDFRLSDGRNIISFKALSATGDSSDFSQTTTIVLDKEPPDLEITSPEDGKHFSGNNRITITGKTEADAQVFANNFLANVNSRGEFEVIIPLKLEGENKVEVKAVDEAGNIETKELKLHFNK